MNTSSESPYYPRSGRFVLIAVIFCTLLVNQSVHAQWLGDPAFEAKISQGINHIYSMSLDSARGEFQDIARLKPDHPAGPFFLAMVEWWTIMTDIDNESHDASFIALIERTIDVCDKRLDKNENDIDALFFKGGAIGFRGRLHANRGDWVKAANDGRIALPIVQQAYKLAPKNYDVLLGIGIYNYYASTIPEQYPIVKPLMLFFPKGDKQRGVTQLLEASQRASYANIEAAYFLVQLYQNYEKLPQQALPLAENLVKRFPRNPIFQKYLGRIYTSLAQWDNIRRVFSEILERSRGRQFGYNTVTEREAEYYLGMVEMQSRRYETALPHFYRCDELSRSLDKNTQSGFMSMTNLRIGMIYDKQGKRQPAIDQYKKVLKIDDYQNAHDQAHAYIDSPYNK